MKTTNRYHSTLNLEEGTATYSSVLVQKIPWTEEPVGYSPWDSKELDTTEAT